MINVQTNIPSVVKELKKKLLTVKDKDKILRTVATTMCAEVRERIHESGLNANGQQIGDYDPDYLKLRQKKYNRNSDSKVVISLTRKLENDFAIGAKDPIKTSGGWGLGFKNDKNFEISKYMEEKYGEIWKLTSAERKQATEIAQFEMNKILK